MTKILFIEDEDFLQIHKKLDNLLINLDALRYKEIYINHDNLEETTYETEVINVDFQWILQKIGWLINLFGFGT